MALRIHFPRIRIQVLLHLRHPTVRFGTEPQLDLHQRLEARVEVGHPEVDELRQLREELLVQGLVGQLGGVGLALGSGQFRGVLVGLLDQFLDPGASGIVVEELVIAFFNAWMETLVETGRGRRMREGKKWWWEGISA